MRRARIAEWLLQAVTTPERAASTAGDLIESAQERGQLWFWSSLLRTTASQMWSGLTDNLQMLNRLVFRAWCMGLVYFVGYTVLRAIADGVSIGIEGHAITGNLSRMTGTTATIIVQILLGRWIACRAPGRAMSAGLALCLYSWVLAIGMAIGLSVGHLRSSPLAGQQWIAGTLQTLVYTLPFLAGASIAPRRAIR